MKSASGIVIVISLLIAGCAQKVEIGSAEEVWALGELHPRVWPAPPAPPRVRYLHTIESAADLGFEVPAVEKLFALVVGKGDTSLTRPYGIAVKGRLLAIADPGAGVVHLLDLKGQYHKRLFLVGETSLISPVGIAIGGEYLFVSDSALNKVFVLDLQGVLVRELDGLERPTGLAFDPETQRLYVAETLAHRIGVFSADGTRLFNVAHPDNGKKTFNAPTHIAFRNGVLLVNDTMNFRVVTLDGDGKPLHAFGTHGTGSGHFSQLKGVDIDSRGNIYVADAIFNRVQIFDHQGNFLLAFGSPGRGEGDMWLPGGVFIVDDRIFVADSHNGRVQVYEYVGEG